MPLALVALDCWCWAGLANTHRVVPAACPVGSWGAPCAAPHLQGPLCHLGCLNLSPGYTKPPPACKLLWAAHGRGHGPRGAESSSRRCQQHVLGLAAPCCASWRVPPPRKSSPRSQRVPGFDPAPAAPCQVPACMKRSSHQKEQIQHFILNTWSPERGGRGRTHTSSLKAPSADTSAPVSCPSVSPRHTDGFSPKSHQAPGFCLSPWQGLSQKAIVATKGRKTLRSGQARQRKMLRWVTFFQLIFFFFMKKDHTEFSNKQNAKKIVLNKT